MGEGHQKLPHSANLTWPKPNKSHISRRQMQRPPNKQKKKKRTVPTPPALEQEFLPDTSTHHVTDLPFTEVTQEEVREAIFKNDANSAPGHSQITYRVHKWAWSADDGRKHITTLIQKCLNNGYHPKSWRRAIAIALPKTNKPDYSNPCAYRLITLLECLSKVLKRVVAKD